MKTILASLLIILGLAGCGGKAVVREPVTVEVAIPYCPRPPVVPTCTLEVDKLQPADAADPGKVGQAYKADMLCLREVQRINEMILEQYTKTSQSFEETQARIRDLVTKMKEAGKPPKE
jgi:hypothetical protein